MWYWDFLSPLKFSRKQCCLKKLQLKDNSPFLVSEQSLILWARRLLCTPSASTVDAGSQPYSWPNNTTSLAWQPVSACIATGPTTRACLHHHRHDNPCLPASPLAWQPVSACITTGTTARVCLHHHWHDSPCLPASPLARQPVSAWIATGTTSRVCPPHHRPDNSLLL